MTTPNNSELLQDIAYLTADEQAELAMLLAQPRDRWCPHQPTPRQQLFLEIESLEAFYGGAVGGGKTDALLMAALEYVDVPGYSALLLMKTFADLSKPGALMDRAHQWLSNTGAEWKGDKKRWEFPNVAGPPAVLDFGYLQTDQDKYNYRTAEYQFIGIDELTRFLKQTYTYLFSRLRRLQTARDIPIRMRSASNPAQAGEPGMFWVEDRFIPKDFDPLQEATMAPRVLVKDGIDERDGRVITRNFVFARLEDNPHLDAEEYELALSELDDISYEQLRHGNWKIRQRGDVYWMFNAQYVFVPWSRWQAVFGVNHIPDHWLLTLSQDQGTSDEHIGATGWFATAAQNSPVKPLVAMYRGHIAIEMAPTEVADALLTLMGARQPKEQKNADLRSDGYGGLAERSRVKDLISSHEAKSERLEYAKPEMGLSFRQWTAGPNIGIAQMRDYLGLIETDKPNPFFPELMGRTQFVCVVPDSDYPVRQADSVWARVEAEFIAYHYKKLKSGEPTAEAVPHPYFNDFMDVIREAAFDAFPRPKRITQSERIESQLDEAIQLPNIPKLSEAEQNRAIISRDIWAREITKREEAEHRESRQPGLAGRIHLPCRGRVVKR
jgi:hypothetical protein